MRRDQFEPGPAFQVESRRGRLMEFGFVPGNPGERDWRVARLERDLLPAAQILVPVENMFEIQAGDGEERFRVRAVSEAMNAVIPGAVAGVPFVVADDGGEVADLEDVMGHN